jgi:hypothetical protein
MTARTYFFLDSKTPSVKKVPHSIVENQRLWLTPSSLRRSASLFAKRNISMILLPLGIRQSLQLIKK